MIILSEARIYVGTYAKYNDGSIEGDWLDLDRFSNIEEFYEACEELHADEEDPEYMFQDYENIPEGLINESWFSSNFFEVRDGLDQLEEKELEPFFIWFNNGHYNLDSDDIDDLISSFKDEYQGQYDSDEDFAREFVDLRDDLSDFARTYFDYEAYARDLFCGDYWSDNGYVFSSN
ncbi:MAG: antirestriction protein ArdA [Candidatus Pedobacter colombiensis]|uniref:Antirestriction protein ArdA n=1 Tax=Candidatus Pedobacter colombiensis TaxID=3121371 RepID=A0AAJ5WCX5_9SPHI|nr:antirestriction protein ArdA [Pedobacter sp.]WEK21326.1 MAG: antirestriction protein ArdA [Pedobacter sp.]